MNTKLNERRVMVVGAHPDDIEIACGATLIKMSDSGYELAGIVLTRGERGGHGAARLDEAQETASFIGIGRMQVLNYADTRLLDCAWEMIAALEAAIADFNPSVILTHSAHDLHQDHAAAHLATLRAARNRGTILCYESPSATPEFAPCFFVDVGEYVAAKMACIQKHRDQNGKPYTNPEQILGRMIFRGAQARTGYAEGFEVVRILASNLGAM